MPQAEFQLLQIGKHENKSVHFIRVNGNIVSACPIPDFKVQRMYLHIIAVLLM